MTFLAWVAALIGAATMTLSVSAYDNSQGVAPFRGLTRSGATTRPGVAACGKALYGRTLYVPGLPERFVTCLDTGEWVGEGNLDVWVPTHGEARRRGRWEMDVLVLPVPAPQVMMVHPCEGKECEQ